MVGQDDLFMTDWHAAMQAACDGYPGLGIVVLGLFPVEGFTGPRMVSG
jgi:hypothetical protein